MAAYYRHSGRVAPSRLAMAVPLGLLGAAVLALAYAYLFAYLPIVGYVSFILAAGFGLVLGIWCGILLRAAHVRSVAISALVTLLVTGFGYYVSWIVWVHAILGRADLDVPLGELASAPGLLWGVISELNTVGTMSIRGWTPNGMILWAFWLLEAILIFVPAILTVVSSQRDSAYCEECKRWCEDTSPVDLVETDLDTIAPRLEDGEINVLTDHPGRDTESVAWTRLDLKRCPCERTNAITVSKVWVVANDKGEREEKSAVVIDRLLLDRTSAEQVVARRPA